QLTRKRLKPTSCGLFPGLRGARSGEGPTRVASAIRRAQYGVREKPSDGGTAQKRARMAADASRSNKREVDMRFGDPLIGRMELYYLVGVAVLVAVAYLIRAAVG